MPSKQHAPQQNPVKPSPGHFVPGAQKADVSVMHFFSLSFPTIPHNKCILSFSLHQGVYILLLRWLSVYWRTLLVDGSAIVRSGLVDCQLRFKKVGWWEELRMGWGVHLYSCLLILLIGPPRVRMTLKTSASSSYTNMIFCRGWITWWSTCNAQYQQSSTTSCTQAYRHDP